MGSEAGRPRVYAAAELGLWGWFATREPLLLAGALLILAAVPFTLIVIMPTNKRLMAASPEDVGPELRPELVKWGTLHWVRNLLGLAFLAALVGE